MVSDIDNSDEQKLKLKLKYFHEGKTCHKGINEMHKSLTKNYYWPSMINDITCYVNSCEICQTAKYERNPPILQFNITPTASESFEHIHIDTFFILNQKFLTTIDAFSKYGQAYHIDSIIALNTIDKILTYITHHGLPVKITVDRGTEFKNNNLENFCKLHKIELHYTTAKNSNSNSPVERFHSTLAEQIRCLKLEKPQETVIELMPYAIIGYNNTLHSVTGYTPFQIINGHINHSVPYELTEDKIISNYIQKYKDKMKIVYNKVQQKISDNKNKIINKLNTQREEACTTK